MIRKKKLVKCKVLCLNELKVGDNIVDPNRVEVLVDNPLVEKFVIDVCICESQSLLLECIFFSVIRIEIVFELLLLFSLAMSI